MTGSPFDNDLIAAYRKQRVLNDRTQSVYLPIECPRASSCWGGIPAHQQPSEEHPASQLSPPWVGRRYGDGRTLVLMENLREYGGFDLGTEAVPSKGMRHLGHSAQFAFRKKGERLLFGNEKSGKTRVWYIAASYAALWLNAAGRLDVRWDGPARLATTTLADAMDLISIVQHVKCSPLRGRGEQSSAMWRNCGEHLLVPELNVLQPERVLVLGTSDNAFAFRSWVVPETKRARVERRVGGKRAYSISSEIRETEYGQVHVAVVPHPAAPGAASAAVLRGFNELLALCA